MQRGVDGREGRGWREGVGGGVRWREVSLIIIAAILIVWRMWRPDDLCSIKHSSDAP